MIELSDHVTRLNRRESTQLDLRLRQLRRQEKIMQRSYEREMYWKRLQLEQINDTLNESFEEFIRNTRAQTPISIHAIKMRRNQSAPPVTRRMEIVPSRPNTTATPFRRTKRAMTIFKDITLKPTCQTLGNLLVLLDQRNQDWPERSKTMMNLKKNY